MMATDKQIEAAALVVFTATVGRAEEYLKAKGQKRRKDFDRLIRRALEAAEAAAWQPIETAPRDGTRVLVFQGSEIANAHWWSDETGGAWIIWARGGSSSRMPNPTHWRPLPAPPKEPTP